ncbi:MAG: alpha-D-ribose 1-methylphosphonate 5-triphosphate diphosphatase, partial [Hyphomicrobiales bacterium]
PHASVQAHDAQIAASGITTVFDALRVGVDEDADLGIADMTKLSAAIEDCANEDGLRAQHFIHLRCEVSSANCLEALDAFEQNERVKLVSLMDHAPGQRQFASLEAYAIYYRGKMGLSEQEFQVFSEKRIEESAIYADKHRRAVAQRCNQKGIVLASHDDATIDHVNEALDQGIAVAEFPTTIEAAKASHEGGLSVLMGAPNLMRGSSHSGNVSARTLAKNGHLDILSSDYIPFSMISAAFLMGDVVEGITLPQAIRTVSANPAEAVGLDDRGSIAIGKQADIVRVRRSDNVPLVRGVWREGERVV